MKRRKTAALVVDASVATKWHLKDEEHEDQALAILELFAGGELELKAPDQIRYEVSSSIAVATRGATPRLTKEQGEDAISEFLELGLDTVSDDALILEAYALVHRYGCALYDALYLALSQRFSVPFVTADRKLYRLLDVLPYVVWVGDYSPGGSD